MTVGSGFLGLIQPLLSNYPRKERGDFNGYGYKFKIYRGLKINFNYIKSESILSLKVIFFNFLYYFFYKNSYNKQKNKNQVGLKCPKVTPIKPFTLISYRLKSDH
ncbi:hypothetical protein PLAN_130109 [Planktothrix rubescens CCAP 1459/22]|uniref:Uncharacterized protein n=1 Tax=Planktothrix rubescens CCAP 1459/22 TaxID=329571 RepID=A0A6J7ZI92_PLARU|nr:hypothetical protein PLAN_130109 [Planktothrix rubescens NIVA-CYA 18]